MKSSFRLFFLYFLYWFVLFAVGRIFFMAYHFELTATLNIVDVMLTMLNGARLDMAMAGYFTLLPGLLISVFAFFNPRILKVLLLIYTGILLFISWFIIVVDFELYSHWNFRMDATPLLYIGKEAAGSGDTITTIILVICWLILSFISIRIYFKLIHPITRNLDKHHWWTSIVTLLFTALLILPIRGTLGVAPINTGTVYFHETNMFANHSAINVIYNFGYAVTKIYRLKYPEDYVDKSLVEKSMKQLITQDTLNPIFVSSKRPNIMMILLESYTFKFIEPLGGLPGITPNINALTKEGILFDNFYSSGDRTDMGIVSVLNGYPRQPLGSIIKFPKKTITLPYINKTLKQKGYHTQFTYGCNIDYANFNSYLSNAQFDNVTHSKDFPDELNTSKWGVHDHYVFDKFFEEAQNASQPFYKIMMTQSSHEPFEVPMETVIEGEDDEHKFLNSAYYTDKCFGEFIEKAKKSTWWDNTLIIVTADHGHFMPNNPGVANPKRFKIPMLWIGGALTKSDTVIHTYGSQTDIANTVFGQLHFQDESFSFSSNMLSPNHHGYAVYIYNNGVGYVAENQVIVFDNTGNQYVREKGSANPMDKIYGKAYLQYLYSDFNNR